MLGWLQREEALVHFRRGLIFEQAHRLDAAVAEYRRAIAHDPHLCEARTALASFYQRYGLTAKALEELRVVANLEDDTYARYQLGCMLTEVGQLDLAIELFQSCLAYAPDHPLVRYRMAVAHFLRGEYIAALGHLAINAPDWEIQQLRGDCLLRLGSYAVASEAFEHAMRHAPPEHTHALAERYQTALRYREIMPLHTIRDWLYAEHATVLLGSPQLDAHRREPTDYPLTYADLGAMIQRFIALTAAFGWQFTMVVAADRVARPLSQVLAHVLQIPEAAQGQDPFAPHQRPLLVLAGSDQPELSRLALDHAPGRAMLLCMGLSHMRQHSHAPEIVGAAVHGACSVPWEPHLRRLQAAGARSAAVHEWITLSTTRISEALLQTPIDPGIEPLTNYYLRHQRIRVARTSPLIAMAPHQEPI
jgi:Flp pilus assembly protein TadD